MTMTTTTEYLKPRPGDKDRAAPPPGVTICITAMAFARGHWSDFITDDNRPAVDDAAPAPDAHIDRNEAIQRIRAALKERSGKPWSVKGGRGTAWGWITVTAPPRRRTKRYRLPPGLQDWPENYEAYDSGEPGHYLTDADRDELRALLGMEENKAHFVGDSGLSIPASGDYYREFVDRAEGREPSVIGVPYWD